ncbi:MAG: hypothetical protein ABJX32_16780 [Tateyamaria sp.]|uniref:hypothetical protein n=1 Tax=Tateyamaria sp. TaxID=1929288 RepID=UPI00329BCA87
MDGRQTEEADVLAHLQRACRNHFSMTAHEFYTIAGLLPQTVRAARLRARKLGEADPVPMLTEGTYNIDLLTAVGWLQRTGRHGCLLRLKAYFDDVALDSISLMRGVRIGSSTSIVAVMHDEHSV